MTAYNNALAWAVLTPIVILGILLAVLAICYYRSVSRSLDIFLLSFLFSLFLNVALVVLIQAILFLISAKWTLQLCRFYIWVTFTSRLAGLFNITALAIDRILILRKPGSHSYRGSTAVKCAVVILWVFCALIGAVPIVGWKNVNFFVDNRCLYISSEIDRGIGIFVIVITLASATISLSCLLDAFLHIRYLKKHNLFTVEPGESRISEIIAQNERERQVTSTPTCVDLASAFDSCRLVCVITSLYLLLNQLPHCVICLAGILLHHSSETIHVVALWFVLLECLLIPQVLWCCNTRYRNGYKHIPDVLLCRGVQPVDEASTLSTRNWSMGDGIQLSGFKQHELTTVGVLVPCAELSNGGHSMNEVDSKETRKTHGRGLSNSDPQVNRSNGPTSSLAVQLHTLPRALSFDSHIDVTETDDCSNAASNEMVSSRNLTLSKTMIDEISSISSESPSREITDRRQVREKSQKDRTDSVKSLSKSRSEWRDAMREKHLPLLLIDDMFLQSNVYDNVGFEANIDLDNETSNNDTNSASVSDQPSTSHDLLNSSETRQISQNQTLQNSEHFRSDTIQADIKQTKAPSVAISHVTESDVTDTSDLRVTDIANNLDTTSLSTTVGSISPHIQNQQCVSVNDISMDVRETANKLIDHNTFESDADDNMKDLNTTDEIRCKVIAINSELESHQTETSDYASRTDEQENTLTTNSCQESNINDDTNKTSPTHEERFRDIENKGTVNSNLHIDDNVYNEDTIMEPQNGTISLSTCGKLFDNSVCDSLLESSTDDAKDEPAVIASSPELDSVDNRNSYESIVTTKDENIDLIFSASGKADNTDSAHAPGSNSISPGEYNGYHNDAFKNTIKPYEEAFTSFSSNDFEDRGLPSHSCTSSFEDEFGEVVSTEVSIKNYFDDIPHPGVESMHSASPIQEIWGDEITENSDFQSFNDMSKLYSLDNHPSTNNIVHSKPLRETVQPPSTWCTFEEEEEAGKMKVPSINIQGSTPPGTLTRTKPQDIWGPLPQTNDSVVPDVTDTNNVNETNTSNPFAVDNYVKSHKVNFEDNSSEPELTETLHAHDSSVHPRSHESTPVADREVDTILSTNFPLYEDAATAL